LGGGKDSHTKHYYTLARPCLHVKEARLSRVACGFWVVGLSWPPRVLFSPLRGCGGASAVYTRQGL
ncbi:MAG: hypothetical protein F7C81_01445, partial [Desulfurococcales archaeon]|nr:hypothetical protein [Desulfurococcales archaeon]